MTQTVEMPVKEQNTPETGKSIFSGVFRQHHLQAVGKGGEKGVFESKNLGLYTYCYQNPLRLIDPDGNAPGDPFKSRVDAAKDFGSTYNDDSIRNNKEYGSSIYSYNDSKGNMIFSYSMPNDEGNHDTGVITDPPNGERLEGFVHSHAAYDPNLGDGNNEFSDTDIELADDYDVPSFISTPKGTLEKYNPKTGDFSTESKEMPSDNYSGRVNQIDANGGKDDPLQ